MMATCDVNAPVGSEWTILQPISLPEVPGLQSEINYPLPSIQIVEQPRERGLRFRYQCEGRAAGTIPGQNSTPDHRTYPTIKVTELHGRSMTVIVSCVTKDNPSRPHPHSLVGKNCKEGVYITDVKGKDTVQFSTLGIQCAKRNDVENSLREREKIKVDPFANASYENMKEIDLGVVRLCFQVFITDNDKCTTVFPVVSNCIYDKKTSGDLSICRLSRQAGSVAGGDEVFLLCEKVAKNDIKVRFFEERSDSPYWEAEADFGAEDVHRQFAICFKTPPYRDQTIQEPVAVQLQLCRPSDNQCSAPKPFSYIPRDPDPENLKKKRKKTDIGQNWTEAGSSSEDVKHRLRNMITANRRCLSEPAYIQNITEEINTDDLLFPDTLYEGLLGLDSILTADIMKLDPL